MANPYTGTVQFYSAGQSTLSLPAGRYRITVTKGIEYKVETREVDVASGATAQVGITLTRWINMPEKGWYRSDDHLHIARPHKELDPIFSKWMQAEDLHVANFLQWGSMARFHNTIQYAHGPSGVYREGNYLIASGQENPRTNALGHTIILGASSPVHCPDDYIVYRSFWEKARRQGALSGFAHGGYSLETDPGAGDVGWGRVGIAVDLPHRLLSFVEVCQMGSGWYEVWYEVLNTGFRIAPTGGTDYPCIASLPGRECNYIQVEGPLTYDSWLEGLRRGRTFVSNGPILEFVVNGKGMGEELILKKGGPVQIQGCVRFDPSRDDVQRLELVRNGEVVKTFEREGDTAEIRCGLEVAVDEACWLAFRIVGSKVGEQPYAETGQAQSSVAHTGVIYVSIEGGPAFSELPRAKANAKKWIARLDDLEARLADDRIGNMIVGDESLTVEHLKNNRSTLMQAIGAARKHFNAQCR